MSEAADKGVRLSKVAREFNLALHTVVEFLDRKGHKVESNPNTKLPGELYDLLLAEFGTDKAIKEQSKATVQLRQERETISLIPEKPAARAAAEEPAAPAAPTPAPPTAPDPGTETIKVRVEKPTVKVLDKIDLNPRKKAAEAPAARGKAAKEEVAGEAPPAAPDRKSVV